ERWAEYERVEIMDTTFSVDHQGEEQAMRDKVALVNGSK
ncbi:hypothetical protein L195_g029772, partial [Trifolium pratense]